MLRYLSLIFIFTIPSVFQMTASELIERRINVRAELMFEYDSLNNSITDSTYFDLKKIAVLQAQIIRLDEQIINDLSAYKLSFEELQIQFDELEDKNEKLHTELEDKNKNIQYGIYGGTFLGGLLLILIFLFIFKAVALSKQKKNYKSILVMNEAINKKLGERPHDNGNVTELEKQLAYNNEVMSEKIRLAEESRQKVMQENENILSQIASKEAHFKSEIEHAIKNLEQQLTAKDYQIENLKREIESSNVISAPNNDFLEEIEIYKKRMAALEEDVNTKEKEFSEQLKNEKSRWSEEINQKNKQIEEEMLQNESLKQKINSLLSDIEKMTITASDVQFGEDNKSVLLEEEITQLKNELETSQKLVLEKDAIISEINSKLNQESIKKSESTVLLNEDAISLNDQVEALKTRLEQAEIILKQRNDSIQMLEEAIRNNQSDAEFAHAAPDIQKLIMENKSLKLEAEGFKKLLAEELEARKEIIKLLHEIRKQ
ncbi:MAG: hypothetical protein PHT69_10595 [Bacteroidales bacterium]|nr:hypothetical protein [Bacteroidales bacterium]